MEPRLVIDNKDKSSVCETDVRKLIRDAKERRCPVGVIVAREESQLRQHDRERRWGQEDGVWILRTTRAWFPRDLEVLKPVFERMRTEGSDFLQRNSALGQEVQRTFVDLDEIEKELKKASRAVEAAAGLTLKYRTRLQALCNGATAVHCLADPRYLQPVIGTNPLTSFSSFRFSGTQLCPEPKERKPQMGWLSSD